MQQKKQINNSFDIFFLNRRIYYLYYISYVTRTYFVLLLALFLFRKYNLFENEICLKMIDNTIYLYSDMSTNIIVFLPLDKENILDNRERIK